MAVKSVKIDAKPRSELGSRANKRLRDKGLVPGVVYGHKEAVVPVTLPKKELVTHIVKGAHLFELGVEGKSETVLIKEVQYDHLGSEVLHVDFARVSLDETVDITVPLELKGEPKGAEEGGVLQQIISALEVTCLVTDIPDIIRHNVSEMALNDVLHIRDIKLPEGVKCKQDEDLIVATVKEIQEEVVAAVVEEGAAEPEVIGRKPDEEAVPADGEAAKEPKKPA